VVSTAALIRARGGPVAGVALLVAAVAVNVVQFPAIEGMVNPRYHAIGRSDTSDIYAIAHQELYWARDRFGIALAFAGLAPDARVLVPTPGPYDVDDGLVPHTLIWLRLARHGPTVTRVPHPAGAGILVAAGIDPVRQATVSGGGSSKGAPWIIAADPVRSGPHREFVLVRWHAPRPGSRYGYQDVFLETSLLPAAYREALRS
jgi:hypothetical protein